MRSVPHDFCSNSHSCGDEDAGITCPASESALSSGQKSGKVAPKALALTAIVCNPKKILLAIAIAAPREQWPLLKRPFHRMIITAGLPAGKRIGRMLHNRTSSSGGGNQWHAR